MNSVKVAYIIMHTILYLALWCAMLLTPIYVTPGWFWWSALCFMCLGVNGSGVTNRFNSWEGMGKN